MSSSAEQQRSHGDAPEHLTHVGLGRRVEEIPQALSADGGGHGIEQLHDVVRRIGGKKPGKRPIERLDGRGEHTFRRGYARAP